MLLNIFMYTDNATCANLRRPADVYLPSWIHGAPAALVVSQLRQVIMIQAAERASAAASAYEAHKWSCLNTDVECTQQGVTFIPMVAESSGGWAPEGLKTLRQLAKTAAANPGGNDDATMGQLLQASVSSPARQKREAFCGGLLAGPCRVRRRVRRRGSVGVRRLIAW